MSDSSSATIKDLLSKSVRALRSSKHDEAVSITREIIQLEEGHAAAHAVQFSSLFKAKKFEQARQMGTMAAKLNPESVFILNNQACLQLEAKQPAAAAGLLKSLIEQFGERGQWLYNLALAQRMVGNYEYSISRFRRTLDHQADHDRAAFQLADCLRVLGHQEEAVRAYDYVRLLRNKNAPSHSNYIHNSVINGSLSRTDLKQELSLWRDRFIPNDKSYTCSKPTNPSQLNIGFLIGVLPQDWLLSIVAPVINQLAQSSDNVTIYWHDEKPTHGLFNDRVAVHLSPGLSDADFARKVRSDNIDVVIDVCGMRLGNRQRALGLQLAYQQFGWLAHVGSYATPAVETIDRKLGKHRFFILDALSTGKNLPENTYAGIGCKQGLSYKVIKTWAQILRETPDWKLHMDATDNGVTRLLIQRFNALGISKDRLLFNPKLSPSVGNIVLDNFIDNDPVSACSAIAAGGILLTLKGELFPATQNAALIHQFDRDSWLCKSPADFIDRALALANGNTELAPVDAPQLHESLTHNLGAFVNSFRSLLGNK
jgi:predicted O-linked N-acetylglucosamine transferase (SPINDLY family)